MRTSPALPGHMPDADAAELALAREMAANRLRENGHAAEADAFERGERDFSWGLYHALANVRAGVGL